jgi:alkylated DNA repair dioxygenase AlkB
VATVNRPLRRQQRVPSVSAPGRDLLGDSLPDGFRYQNDLISSAEERQLIAKIEYLPFRAFEFHSFTGKRRVVSFGWRYDFNGGGLTRTEDIPEFLLGIRDKAARFANIQSDALQQVLVTEYAPGAAIGWHKDRSVFGDVVGVSLVSPCTFRLRRKVGTRWDRRNLTAEPRSVYLLRGPSRSEWEHSIPALNQLRYSLTFRNIRENGA